MRTQKPTLITLILVIVHFSDQISGMKGYQENKANNCLYYSAAAYCKRQSILEWNCGSPCANLPEMHDVTLFTFFDRDLSGFSGYN